MIPANTVWFGIFVIVVVYVVARWVRAHTVTEDEEAQAPHYRIRSAAATPAEAIGPTNGLTVSRYYYRDTDLEMGPTDPADFYDELFIELRDPESGQLWQNSMFVATLKGLDRVMVEEHWDSVVGTELLLVRRYDRETILHGALDHLQEIYEAQIKVAGKP